MLNQRRKKMVSIRKGVFYPLALLSVVAIGAPAMAQGVVGSADEGAHEGARAAGPVGAIVGGAVGAAAGAVGGILGVDDRPRFREYVVERHLPSYSYQGPVRVGTVLPPDGVTYYDVPAEYGVREYRYTVVDDEPVLVDPYSRRIVEVIN
jgi:hypothetical protein